MAKWKVRKRARRAWLRIKKTRLWWRRTKARTKKAWIEWNLKIDPNRQQCLGCGNHVLWWEMEYHLDQKCKSKKHTKVAPPPRMSVLTKVTTTPNKGKGSVTQPVATPAATPTAKPTTPTAKPAAKAPPSNVISINKNGTKDPVGKTNPGPKPTPKSKGKSTMSSGIQGGGGTGGGMPEGHEAPWSGIDDAVVGAMVEWSGRHADNFETEEADAEKMGEMWHGVADALNKKADSAVEECGFLPNVVEGYQQAAQLCAQIADCHKMVADSVKATYGQLIDALETSPRPSDIRYLDRK